jgi:hypothetical protein
MAKSITFPSGQKPGLRRGSLGVCLFLLAMAAITWPAIAKDVGCCKGCCTGVYGSFKECAMTHLKAHDCLGHIPCK